MSNLSNWFHWFCVKFDGNKTLNLGVFWQDHKITWNNIAGLNIWTNLGRTLTFKLNCRVVKETYTTSLYWLGTSSWTKIPYFCMIFTFSMSIMRGTGIQHTINIQPLRERQIAGTSMILSSPQKFRQFNSFLSLKNWTFKIH